MTSSDVVTICEWLVGAWLIGWCSGFLVYTFKRLLDLV